MTDPVKRWTSQTSFDGLSHRMVEFEHGEYVRFCDYVRAEAALTQAREALQNAVGVVDSAWKGSIYLTGMQLEEMRAALAATQQEDGVE